MTAVAQVSATVMALLTACSREGGGPGAAMPDSVWTAPIQTGTAAYTARPVADSPAETHAFTVVARSTNPTERTVFLVRGMPASHTPPRTSSTTDSPALRSPLVHRHRSCIRSRPSARIWGVDVQTPVISTPPSSTCA